MLCGAGCAGYGLIWIAGALAGFFVNTRRRWCLIVRAHAGEGAGGPYFSSYASTNFASRSVATIKSSLNACTTAPAEIGSFMRPTPWPTQ
ncbi:hypothetical protein DSM104635_01699 [Terricaulis silvestris]|uniref:Uncharacterized protein n=1 Tax=Terricaulis silvestris TaxID=2686094 RepID=A0A6I6MQ03_9CAUL|nr:hypothetical protein DSM104635_01699 [Terricaulis silvestris]